jgi:hypothetical protein
MKLRTKEMVFVAFLMQEFQEKHVSYWKHLLHEFSAGSREEGKEGDQVFTSQEEPQADDPIELLNRMSGKSEQFRSTGNKNISPITPSFEHDGYEHAKTQSIPTPKLQERCRDVFLCCIVT